MDGPGDAVRRRGDGTRQKEERKLRTSEGAPVGDREAVGVLVNARGNYAGLAEITPGKIVIRP